MAAPWATTSNQPPSKPSSKVKVRPLTTVTTTTINSNHLSRSSKTLVWHCPRHRSKLNTSKRTLSSVCTETKRNPRFPTSKRTPTLNTNWGLLSQHNPNPNLNLKTTRRLLKLKPILILILSLKISHCYTSQQCCRLSTMRTTTLTSNPTSYHRTTAITTRITKTNKVFWCSLQVKVMNKNRHWMHQSI